MSSRPWCLGVIPARASSTRFPNKITAPIQGKPMIQHVWEAAKRVRRLSEVVVATEDEAIAEAVHAFGGEVVLTPKGFTSGTDRVAWVARQREADAVVNLQGDEPLIRPEALDALIAGLLNDESCDFATLAVPRQGGDQLRDPNVVKVLVSAEGTALYFSRHPLATDSDGRFYKHVGVYAFRPGALQRFCELPPSPLEVLERLEQLRALERGFRIRVVMTVHDTIAVDTPEDLARVQQHLDALMSLSQSSEGYT